MRYAGWLAASLIAGALSSSFGGAAAQNAAKPANAPSPGVTAPLREDYVEANGIRFHYVHAGPIQPEQAPMILFLHGYPSFWYQWKDQLIEFGKDHFAVAPDLRGYNLTTIPTDVNQYQMKYLVEDVRAFAEKVGGKGRKFVLVGHDWGGPAGLGCSRCTTRR